MPAAPNMNRYWIPHLDIAKKVITQEIQCYLGPEAAVRSYTQQGEDGYLITTPGPPLTDEQIHDLCESSRELWARQAAAINQQNPDRPLKHPLHQPIVIPRGLSDGAKHHINRRGAVSKRTYEARRGNEAFRH